MIDQASVFAERFKGNPQVLQATVLGQGNIPGLDPYTALNALKLIKESQRMEMAGRAQQPTSSPSIVAEALAPAPSPQGLGAMVPNTMGQMPPGTPQGLAAIAPQQRAPVMQRSGGLASMPTPEENYAEGGIVAFSGQTGSAVKDPDAPAVKDNPYSRLDTDGEERGVGLEDLMFTSKGDPETYGKLAAIYPGAIQSLGNITETEIKPETLRKVSADEIAAYREAMGPNVAEESMRADIKARRGEMSKNLEEGKGVALLKAAMAVTQGNNWVRAFAGAGAAFGDEYNRAIQADKAEKRSIAVAEFNLADAKRKESLGLFKEGRAAQDRYVSAVKAADKAKLDKAKAYADAIKGGMNATKPLSSAFRTGAGAGEGKLPQVDRDAAAMAKQIIDLESTNPDDPKLPALKKKLAALEKIIAANKDIGPNRLGAQETQIFVGAAKEATSSARKRGNQDAAYLAALRNRDAAAANNRMKEIYAEEIQKFFPSTPLSDLLAAAPPGDLTPTSGGAPAASKPAASAARVMSMADVQATAAASGKTTQEVIDAAKAKGYTIK